MKHLNALIILFILSACSSGPVGNASVPQPAKAVDLIRYVGLWYEVARYENRFEKGCEAVTAKYSTSKDDIIKVLNTCHKGPADGAIETADGKAKIVENSNNAKLKVSFFGPFYFGDYWVLDRADDYSWSIVGEPSGRYLWILSRKPTLTNIQMDELINMVKAMGYDTSLLYYPKHSLTLK